MRQLGCWRGLHRRRRKGRRQRVRGLHCVRYAQGQKHGKVFNVLAISFCWHRWGAQVRREFSIAERPLVHWQFVSVTPQLESGSAATKQGICLSLCQLLMRNDMSSCGLRSKNPIGNRQGTRTYSTLWDTAQVLSTNERKRSRNGKNGSLETHLYYVG
jgi:hypothetical protein